LNLLGLIAGPSWVRCRGRSIFSAAPWPPIRASRLIRKPRTLFLGSARLDEAIAMGRQAVTVNPNSPETHNLLGYILQQANDRTRPLSPCGEP